MWQLIPSGKLSTPHAFANPNPVTGPRWPRPGFALIAIFASLASLALPGCWMIRAHHLANSIESDIPLNQCIRSTGVEPIELASCIRHSKNKRAANTCEPPPQEAEVKACIRDCPTHIFWVTVCRQPTD
ncbi:MAG TPA: hypothetical protein VHY56_14910 [Candidatus Binataceae bacterium]|nr:hypothetical protein [Candidatus Binataceae bacterium]